MESATGAPIIVAFFATTYGRPSVEEEESGSCCKLKGDEGEVASILEFA
jgi:hypothetical protein